MIKNQCRQDLYQWHQWFAWHPVYTRSVKKGSRYCWTKIWWETIWRRTVGHYCGDEWEYSVEKPDETEANS